MSPRGFDRFMVVIELGGNPKVARLNDAEFRCLITGVWALAAKANPRGALLVGKLPATPADIAHQARKPESLVKRTLDKMRVLGMLEHDPDLGCEVVHDWDEINPPPRPSESPDAWRARKQKQRVSRENGASVTSDCPADVTRDTSGHVTRDTTDVSFAKSRECPATEVEVEGKAA